VEALRQRVGDAVFERDAAALKLGERLRSEEAEPEYVSREGVARLVEVAQPVHVPLDVPEVRCTEAVGVPEGEAVMDGEGVKDRDAKVERVPLGHVEGAVLRVGVNVAAAVGPPLREGEPAGDGLPPRRHAVGKGAAVTNAPAVCVGARAVAVARSGEDVAAAVA